MTWTPEAHTAARAAATAFDTTTSKGAADELGLEAAAWLTDALDEIERLNQKIVDMALQDDYPGSGEADYQVQDFPLAVELLKAKRGANG